MAEESVISLSNFIDLRKTRNDIKEIIINVDGKIPNKKRDDVAGILIDSLHDGAKKLNKFFNLTASGEIESPNKPGVIDIMIGSCKSELIKQIYSGDYYSDSTGGVAIKRFFDELSQISDPIEFASSLLEFYKPNKKRDWNRIKAHLDIKDKPEPEPNSEVVEPGPVVVESEPEDDGKVEIECCVM